MSDVVITPVVRALDSDCTGVGSDPSDAMLFICPALVNLMRLVFHAQTNPAWSSLQWSQNNNTCTTQRVQNCNRLAQHGPRIVFSKRSQARLRTRLSQPFLAQLHEI